MIASSVKLRGDSKWERQKIQQIEEKPARYNPKFILYGAEGTGKTHNICSACLQKEYVGKRNLIPAFSPLRIIDCNRSANLIATKDFADSYRGGDIIIINPYIRDDGTTISDPIERFMAVWELVRDCKPLSTGSLVIDGYDQVERDALYFIYQQFDMYEDSLGRLWKKGTMEKGGERKDDERVKGIVQFMYTPRNTKIRAMLSDLSMINIPVIITCHPEEKYVGTTATGIMETNIRKEFDDDADCIVFFENFKLQRDVVIAGRKTLEDVSMRRMTVKKNRFQKGKAPDLRSIEKDSFEFTDVFNLLTEGL